MPIYANYGVNKAPWTLKTSIPFKELNDLVKIFLEARKTFAYKGDTAFLSTITPNTKLEEAYIARFDIGRSMIPEGIYMQNLEALINECNLSLETLKKKKKFPDYKYDIIGNWDSGKIIILEKKKK